MVCTISFSHQNFRVFRVNGKRPLVREIEEHLQPGLYISG